MADLLLELFSEEIPARMQEKAADYLWLALASLLDSEMLAQQVHKKFVTPRRLALLIENLPTQQPDVVIERKGPKTDAPQAAIDGFLKSTGLTLNQLEKRNGVYFASVEQKGKPTAEYLKLAIEEVLSNFKWPKSMRWGAGSVSWVRPLHSILCIFDGKVVPVEFAGLKAGNVTYGHRFLAPKEINITDPAKYEAALEKAYVIADAEVRKAKIKAEADKLAASKNLSVKPDDGLLAEVTGLVEWPVLLMGSIDAKFMDLPPEVLTMTMRAHQKYFALLDKSGALSAQFLITANMETKDKGKAIIAGNERVLRARFSDARFFWDQDRKTKLDEWAKSLATVTFHAKLGSVADKVSRIEKLAAALAEKTGANAMHVVRAAKLCKADLVTGMVGEFAELQGVMGRYYAQGAGEKAEIADAIRDHYLPLGPNTAVPVAPVSVCVALADKFDTLISMFAIGEKPTGSKDPFALRRAALGVIRIVLENNLRLNLRQMFEAVPAQQIALHKAHEKLVEKTEASLQAGGHKVGKYLTVSETAYEDLGDIIPANLSGMLYDFFIDRLKVQLKDQGIRHDVIAAVVANGDDDLVRIVNRAKALQEFLGSEDGKNLLAGYKRAANILSIEEKKDKKKYDQPASVQLMKLPEEQALSKALAQTSQGMKALLEQEKYIDTMAALSKLRAPVDVFFDKILVNDQDPATRANRLNLLGEMRTTLDTVANFALIEG